MLAANCSGNGAQFDCQKQQGLTKSRTPLPDKKIGPILNDVR